MRAFYNYEEYAETTVLRTIHGSHLYGLANEHSDNDNYEVFLGGYGTMKRYAEQHVDEHGEDLIVIHLDRFIQNVNRGAPQALEALFSTEAYIDPRYAPLLQALRPSRYATYDRYRRTALNFGLSHGGRSAARASRDSDYDRFKLARHALRLTLNLNDFMLHGFFNPTLSADEAEYITTLATAHEAPAFEYLLRNMLEAAGRGTLRER